MVGALKAFANIDSHYALTTGQIVVIEAANRVYSIEGSVLEIGSRIVEYDNPSNPTGLPLWGKEIFISLPVDNDFLYGEQVLVYPPSE